MVELRDYFAPDHPFGPLSTTDIHDAESFAAIFSKDNLIYSELHSHPSLTLIIGRRGSGKTAFLRSVTIDETYEIKIELSTHKPFREIITSIEEISKGAVLVEEVADLWNVILWVPLLVEVAKLEGSSDAQKLIRRYLDGLELNQTPRLNPYAVMRRVIGIIRARGGDSSIAMAAEFTDQMIFNDVVFEQAQEAALDHLKQNNMRSIILLDSLENFALDDQTMCHAIAGFLHAQGKFHSAGSPCELRCCIPAEIYHVLLDLSSNPNKDFQHRVLLHWSAGELLRIAAQRYAQFLRLYEPKIFEESFAHLDLKKRYDAQVFWHSILPNKIQNKVGGTEDALPYILRHTQLLPRQFLLYLNQIAVKNAATDGHVLQFQHNAVVDGVFEIEHTICSEIFKAFEYVHPGAKVACERCLRYLPTRFTDGELHKVYNQHGKGRITDVYDFEDFKKLLIEIGVIGRVIRTTGRYIEGVFEYAVPHKLITNTDDELCVHPVYSQTFRVNRDTSTEDGKLVVYPYGCTIDASDRRQIS